MKSVITVVLISILLVGCASNDSVVNVNYERQLIALQELERAKQESLAQVTQVCANDANPAACVMGTTLAMMGGQNSGTRIPAPPQQRPSFGERLMDNSFNLLGAALPFVAQVKQASYNRDIAVEREQTQRGLYNQAFGTISTLGSIPTTSISAGGDYINGDGNVSGDGNIIGDGNGDGDRFGDGATVVGNDLVSGDNNYNSGRLDSDDINNGDDRENDNGDNRDNTGNGDNRENDNSQPGGGL